MAGWLTVKVENGTIIVPEGPEVHEILNAKIAISYKVPILKHKKGFKFKYAIQ